MEFHKNILDLVCQKEQDRICTFIESQMNTMRKDGIIVGLSGGIDSALTASLCVNAIGKDRVFGLILPEKDSNPVSSVYAQREADRLEIESKTVDITSALEAFGTYEKRDRIVQSIFPEYSDEWKFKITLPQHLLEKDAFNVFTITIEHRKGEKKASRLNKDQLNGIVAATDTKQRMRMMHLYYYAEARNLLVCGTTNKSEVLQGFFVKHGDGGVDIEPLAHLFKVQVFQLSRFLQVNEEIINRKPSPDTFSSIVSDEEFYFRIPYDQLDLLLFAWEQDIPIKSVCDEMGLKEEQVKRAFRDFQSKYNATKHLREMPPSINNPL